MLVYIYLKVIRPLFSKAVFRCMAKKFNEDEKKQAQLYLENIFSSLNTISDIVSENERLSMAGFTWKPDPMGGALDFSPEELWLFIARKGDDCDGWAEFNFQACKRINLKPRMWVIIDGFNLKTSHVITTCYDPDSKKYYLFNNNSARTFDTEEECIGVFTKEQGGVYKNLKKYLFRE